MPELWVASYRGGVTTQTEFAIAGVPWPMHKLLALIVGVLVLALIGVVTASMGTAVLTAAGIATVIWVAGSMAARR